MYNNNANQNKLYQGLGQGRGNTGRELSDLERELMEAPSINARQATYPIDLGKLSEMTKLAYNTVCDTLKRAIGRR